MMSRPTLVALRAAACARRAEPSTAAWQVHRGCCVPPTPFLLHSTRLHVTGGQLARSKHPEIQGRLRTHVPAATKRLLFSCTALPCLAALLGAPRGIACAAADDASQLFHLLWSGLGQLARLAEAA